MAGRPMNRAHELIAESLKLSITPPTPRRDTPVEYGAELLVEMIQLARMGYSGAEICDHWSISQAAMAGWVQDKPEFAAAYARAAAAAQAWWEAAPRRAMAIDNNKFPAGAWAQVVRARFAEYGVKVEVNHHLDISQLVTIRREQPELTLIEGRAAVVRTLPDGGGPLEAA